MAEMTPFGTVKEMWGAMRDRNLDNMMRGLLPLILLTFVVCLPLYWLIWLVGWALKPRRSANEVLLKAEMAVDMTCCICGKELRGHDMIRYCYERKTYCNDCYRKVQERFADLRTKL